MEIVTYELTRRYVDRQTQRRAPSLCPTPYLCTGSREHPATKRLNEACLLGDGNETHGRNRPLLRMRPADQGFNASDSAIAERDLRLIMNREALGLERA
jgi:hypothetical protein